MNKRGIITVNEFTKIEKQLNKIDLHNGNKYDLLNLYESVMMGEEDEKTLSEMLESNTEAEKIHDFLCGTLNEGGWYGEPREKSYYYQADYHLPDYFYSQTVYDIPSSEIGDDVELSIKKYIADQEGYGEDEEYIDGIEVWNIREYDDDGDFVDESLSESNSSTIDEIISQFKSSVSDGLFDEKTISSMVDDMKKAKSSYDAFDIGNIYTNLNFFRFKDNDEIVRSSKRVGDKDVYFDRELAKPYIEKHQKNESLSESEDIQSQIDELEERIQKLVKRYKSAQKQYHGDSSLSKRIEAEISGLEDEQRKLKSKLHTEESLSEAYKLRVGYKDKETNRTYSREYPYNGDTDKKDIGWLKDADKIAFDNCAPNEDVLGYNLVEVGENESLSEAQERQAKIEVRKVYSWYDVYVDNVLLLKKLSEEDAKEIMKTMDDNHYPYIYRETEESRWSDEQKKKVTEDTVKQGSQWVNKGKEGTHGKFKTKKEADAQRKAMFARGFKEGVEEEKTVIYKEGGIYKTTPESNYNSRIQNARKIHEVDWAESAEDIINYYIKNGWAKSSDEFKIVEGVKESIEDVWDDASLSGDSMNYKGHEIKLTPYGYQVTFDNGEEIEFADDREAMEYIDSLNEDVNDSSTLPDDHIFWDNGEPLSEEEDKLFDDFVEKFFDTKNYEIEYKDIPVEYEYVKDVQGERAGGYEPFAYFSKEYNVDYWYYTPDDILVKEEICNYLADKFPEKLTVADAKKSEKEIYEYLKNFFYEEAEQDAIDNYEPD